MIASPSPSAAVAAGLAATVERLSAASRTNYESPYDLIDWPPALDPEGDWFSSPELSSLYGTPAWDALDDRQRRRLSFLEAVNFYSLNIHGERTLMEGLARRLYRPDLAPLAPYLHHFLDEENKHSVYFGGFCQRYASIYPDRKLAFGEDSEPGLADFLFFARVLVFEEIVDRYNIAQGKDERLHPLARLINQRHHADEARHLIFGRKLVTALWDAWRTEWSDAIRADIDEHLTHFVAVTWREYFNPTVYADLGLDDPWGTADEAWAHPGRRSHRRQLTEKASTLLLEHGIVSEDPSDAG